MPADQMRRGIQGSFVKGPKVDEDIYYLLQKYFNAENIKLFVNYHFSDPSSVVQSRGQCRSVYSFCAGRTGLISTPGSGVRPQLIFRDPRVKT